MTINLTKWIGVTHPFIINIDILLNINTIIKLNNKL